MSVRHVFERIKTVDRNNGGTWITLTDGTKIGLSPSALKQTEPLKPGMKALLDLEDWFPRARRARLYVYDRYDPLMIYNISADDCFIESPVLSPGGSNHQ